MKKSSRQLLKSTFTKSELKTFKKGFKLFSKIYNTYTYNAKVQEWIDAHESIREEYRPLIEQNSAYGLEYAAVAEHLYSNFEECLDLSEVYYRIALKCNFEDIYMLYDVAWFLGQLEDKKEEAIELCLKGLQLGSDDSTILNSFGVFCQELKSLDLAYQYYSKALALDPRSSWYMSNLGKVCVEIGGEKYQEEARALFEGATKMDPHSGVVWHRLADYLWIYEQKYDAAEAAYLSGLAVDPDNTSLIGNLGELYIDIRGEQDRGLELYKKALGIRSSAYRLITMITLQVEHYKDYEEGKRYYEKLIERSFHKKVTRDDSLTDAQWNAFLEAEKILLEELD